MEPVDPLRWREIHRDADARLHALYAGKVAWAARPAALERKLSAVYSTLSDADGAVDAFERLRWHPALTETIFRLEPVIPALGPQPGNTALDALMHLACRHTIWHRVPEDWETPPSSSTPRPLFASLAAHLLTHWPVPAFLEVAWFYGFGAEGDFWREVYQRVGAGTSLKTLTFLAPLTERARHYFLLAPTELLPAQAMRWGQLKAMGADEALTRAALESPLGGLLPDEAFWETALRFFVQRPDFPRDQIGPAVDFIRNRREGIEPGLSMQGRTTKALLERIDDWHATLAKQEKGPRRHWPGLGLDPFALTMLDPNGGGATLTWNVVELTDTLALMEEGCEMRHCVRSYAAECAQGVKSVFSLRLESSEFAGRKRMLTIEVNRARRAVVQVRGRANAAPRSQRPGTRLRLAGEIVRRWARARHLGIACSC